jgi:DNA-binding MurR/RpiR family transcriptional regulator
MIYDKFSVVFLTTIASEKSNSTNSIIASYILKHIDELQNLGISSLASQCHVSMSSISRFCKDIGLRDFVELKELLLQVDFDFEEQSNSQSIKNRIHDYTLKINESISMVEKTIDIKQIIKLCNDIKNYDNVAIFGLLKAASVAFNLQCDLLMMNKQVYTHISYHEQIEYLNHVNEDNLIVLFSYTGSYFDYLDIRSITTNLSKSKIWLISGDINKEYPNYIDEVITFSSKQDQGSHPYQLQFIASLIAQEYAKRKE